MNVMFNPLKYSVTLDTFEPLTIV